jgi:hypothetical protein
MPIDKGRIKRETLWIPYWTAFGLDGSGGTPVSAHTGAAVEKEIGTTGAVGLLLDTAGDMINVYHPVPRDLNWAQPIGVRVKYVTGSATAADTVEWIVLYDVLSEGTAIAVGSTPLDTVVGSETVTGTANAIELSGRGIINGNAVTQAQVRNTADFSFLVELQAFAAGLTEDKFFMGLLVDYVPKRGLGSPESWNPSIDREGL